MSSYSAAPISSQFGGHLPSPRPLNVTLYFLSLQANDFHMGRITVEQDIAKKFTDNDLVLLTKDHPHGEACRINMHALGFVEGHEGSQSLRVKFYLTDDSQAGKPAQLERCGQLTVAMIAAMQQ